MKRIRTWMVVADGGSARLIRQLRANPETGERLEDLQYSQEQKRLGQIMSDRPGRSFASTGHRRSSMEYGSDPVRERQGAFAREIVAALSEMHEAGSFDRLVIVAEPRMLGLIRDALNDRLRAIVVEEIDKDFVKLPREKLIEAIVASSAVIT